MPKPVIHLPLELSRVRCSKAQLERWKKAYARARKELETKQKLSFSQWVRMALDEQARLDLAD